MMSSSSSTINTQQLLIVMKTPLTLKKTILAGLALVGATSVTPVVAANYANVPQYALLGANPQPQINLNITSQGITAPDPNARAANIGKEDMLPLQGRVDKGNDPNVVFDHIEVSLGYTSNFVHNPLVFPNDKDALTIIPALKEDNSFEIPVKGQYDGPQEVSIQGFWNVNGKVQPVGDKYIINVEVK